MAAKTEASYSVVGPRCDLAYGRFVVGDRVYASWLDGQADNLVRMGLLAYAGDVPVKDVPKLELAPPPVDVVVLGNAPAGAVLPEPDGEDVGEDVGEEPSGDVEPDAEWAAALVAGSSPGDVLAAVEGFPVGVLVLVLAAEREGPAREGLLLALEEAIAASGGEGT